MEDIARGAVRFFGPYDQPRVASLKVRNMASRPIVYRLKCSKPLDFNIEPSGLGLLRPNDTHQLSLIASPEIDRNREYTIVLEYGLIDAPSITDSNSDKKEEKVDTTTNPAVVWKQVNVEKLSKTGISVIFGPEAKTDEESETTVIAINESMLAEPEKGANAFDVLLRIRTRHPSAWQLLLWFLFILAVISFLFGMWIGFRTKYEHRSTANIVGGQSANEGGSGIVITK